MMYMIVKNGLVEVTDNMQHCVNRLVADPTVQIFWFLGGTVELEDIL